MSYTEEMHTIENELLALLNAQGGDNIRTNNGTAYKSNLMAVKITDRQAFLDYVLDQVEEHGDCAMLIASPRKDEVRGYLDQHQEPPPGLAIENMVTVNIRRA